MDNHITGPHLVARAPAGARYELAVEFKAPDGTTVRLNTAPFFVRACRGQAELEDRVHQHRLLLRAKVRRWAVSRGLYLRDDAGGLSMAHDTERADAG